jgi:branched-chain amino acid transport system ATP-binding protein
MRPHGNRERTPLDEAATTQTGASLSVSGVAKSFGAVRAVQDVSFEVSPGSFTCLIGPNGAGKSTLLGCVAGFLRHDAGRILVEAEDVSSWSSDRRARNGLGTVFQSATPVAGLDVLGNAMVGCHAWTHRGFVAGVLRLPGQRREEQEIREAAEEALELVGLAPLARRSATGLPFGQLRLLAIARVLAQRPRVLLLDEPVAGLRAAEKARLQEVFLRLRERGFTQILVEHDMQFVGAVADRMLVLDRGALIADGSPAEIRSDERVVSAYLGTATV